MLGRLCHLRNKTSCNIYNTNFRLVKAYKEYTRGNVQVDFKTLKARKFGRFATSRHSSPKKFQIRILNIFVRFQLQENFFKTSSQKISVPWKWMALKKSSSFSALWTLSFRRCPIFTKISSTSPTEICAKKIADIFVSSTRWEKV